jgi:hypothetical protein
MGSVQPEVTQATFYVFSPALIAAYLPRAWDLVPPEQVVEARYAGVEAALRRGLEGLADTKEVAEAAELAWSVLPDLPHAGRTLAAAHARLPRHPEPLLALWQALTVLREYRGDGHVATLLTHGIDAVQALVLDAAYSGKPQKYYEFRSFDADETKLAVEALRARAFIAADGTITEGGAKFREMIEIDTDRLASPAFDALTPERKDATVATLARVVERAIELRAVPRFVERLYRKQFPG